MSASSDIPSGGASYRSLAELRARFILRLKQLGIVNAASLQELQQRAAWKKEPLEQLVLREGLINEDELLQLLSELSGIAMLDARTAHVEDSAVEMVPARSAVHFRIMPIHTEGNRITLATARLRDTQEESEIKVILGRSVGWRLCTEREVNEFITHYYGVGIDAFLDLEESNTRLLPSKSDSDEPAGIPAFVDAIIRDAIHSNATDIHVEPHEDNLHVRYRIDGVLYPAPMPRGMARYRRALVSSLKVMAQLNIAERRLPQDGRFEKTLDNQSFDVRVSVLPTRHGESIELRLLNRSATFLRMQELGMPPAQREALEELIELSYGLVLFTGPTGSGKTTSLYAALAHLNNSQRKIVTIEDPVEYQIRGITQMQVQPQIGFTFASGLRSTLRHDPDIILVGEIRDDETADIAISASLTGHLVLSTLHTNDTAGAPTRLVDMGIEPYLVASSLQGIVAQRLIRRMCMHCREEVVLDEKYLTEVEQHFPERTDPTRTWRGRGCPFCRFTGYQGRRALYEILDVTEEMRTMIIERAPSNAIMRHAIQRGITPLRKAGWEMVLNGDTTLEDLLRVTSRIQKR